MASMDQREAVALAQICAHLLIEFVILEQRIEFFEDRISLGCHLWHSRKHVFGFIAINEHLVCLLLLVFPLLFSSLSTRGLGRSGFTGSFHSRYPLRHAQAPLQGGWGLSKPISKRMYEMASEAVPKRYSSVRSDSEQGHWLLERAHGFHFAGDTSTTVPLKRFKPKTGTKPETEARPARYAPTDTL